MVVEDSALEKEGLLKEPRVRPEELVVKSKEGQRVETSFNFQPLFDVLPAEEANEAKAAFLCYFYSGATLVSKKQCGKKRGVKELQKEIEEVAETFKKLTGVSAEAVLEYAKQ